MLTLVVDFEADGADALVRLQMEPHLVGHADNQVRNEAAGQTAGVHKYKRFLFHEDDHKEFDTNGIQSKT